MDGTAYLETVRDFQATTHTFRKITLIQRIPFITFILSSSKWTFNAPIVHIAFDYILLPVSAQIGAIFRESHRIFGATTCCKHLSKRVRKMRSSHWPTFHASHLWWITVYTHTNYHLTIGIHAISKSGFCLETPHQSKRCCLETPHQSVSVTLERHIKVF